MSFTTLSGKECAQKLLESLKPQIEALKIKPSLGIVVVGEDKPSQIYVKKKCEKAQEFGLTASVFRFPEDITQNALLEEIRTLNADKTIDGFIVQMPLPKHISPDTVIAAIDPQKDVDGFTSTSMGKVMQNILDESTFWPATPFGVLKLLEYYNVSFEGKHAVIIGRGNVVGKPLSMMLLHKNATVTICHSKTRDLSTHTKKADILVCAAGSPALVKASMVKKGAYVVDVGTSRVVIDGKEKVVGDVDFNSVIKKAHSSPVPGGVGPMTVAMLIANTVKAAKLKR